MIDPYDYVPFNAARVLADKYMFEQHYGNMPLHDLFFLDMLVNDNKKEGMVAFEIGAWTGMSTCCIGKIVKECHGTLTTIDNFSGSNDLQELILGKVDVRKILEKNLKRFGVDDVVTILERDSSICDDIPDESIDFMFIDGDHRYTQFKKDVRNWYPKIKKDGIFSGHDCTGGEWKKEFLEQDAELIGNGAIHHGVNKVLAEEFGDKVGLYIKDGTILSSIWIVKKEESRKEIASIVSIN